MAISTGAYYALSPGITALATAFLSTAVAPLLGVITSVVGVTTITVLIYNSNFLGIKDITNEIGKTIDNAIDYAGEAISDIASTVLNFFK